MACLAILTQLFLIGSGFAATQPKCVDMDSQACQLMAVSNPNLCNEGSIAEAACPKFCNLCPIECYHCNTTLKDFHSCTTTKLCAKNEVCMQKVVTSTVDGHHAYQLTCETKDRCDGSDLTLTFGKRDVEARDVSISCCLKDHCNYPGTTTGVVTTGIQGCKKDVFVVFETALEMSTSTIKNFLSHLAASLPIGQDGVLMSVTSVSHHAVSLLWHLNAYTDKTNLTDAINHMERTHSGRVDRTLDSHNEAAILALKMAPENRVDAEDILITITNKNDEVGHLHVHTLSNSFLGKFDKVISVGVGHVHHVIDEHEHHLAQGTTSSPGSEFYVTEQNLNGIVPSVASVICPTSN